MYADLAAFFKNALEADRKVSVTNRTAGNGPRLRNWPGYVIPLQRGPQDSSVTTLPAGSSRA
jgi:hypothetical protein